MNSQEKLPNNYSIGLFSVDRKKNTVTLAPGVYVIPSNITFGIDGETRIEGVMCQPLKDVNSAKTVFENIVME